MSYYITCDYVTITVTYVTVTYNIMLTSNSKSKIRKIDRKEKENKKWNKSIIFNSDIILSLKFLLQW